jgi:hypothetical protein
MNFMSSNLCMLTYFDELRVVQVNDAERREQQQHSCTRQGAAADPGPPPARPSHL